MLKIVSVHPQDYPLQGLRGCGGYSAKAILSAFGKPTLDNPLDYYMLGQPSWLARPSTWADLFRSYGLHAEHGNISASRNKLIAFIKEHVDNNSILMLRVGSGYSRQGKWHWLRWRLIGHWITIWGYDECYFYLYDCYTYPDPAGTLPIGNKKRIHKAVIRDWKGGLPHLWRRSYVAVRQPEVS